MITVDTEKLDKEPEGTAFYRLPDDLMEFLVICQQRHGIMGFEWDPEDRRNFGVILENPRNDESGFPHYLISKPDESDSNAN